MQHFYHKEVIFDADVKVENYYHHDEEQLLFYKKVYTEQEKYQVRRKESNS